MSSQKFWEWLVAGILAIIIFTVVVGAVRDKLDYTQVILALIGLVGLIRGALLRGKDEADKDKDEEGKHKDTGGT